MIHVTIKLDRNKPAERLDFMAWKDDRKAFYARPHNGSPCVVMLTPALPDGAQWTENPLPEVAPVGITNCRLLPPPCLGSENEWQTRFPEEWEAVYWKTHGQRLHLSPSDDAPLLQRLADYKDVEREDYEEKLAAAVEQTKDADQRALCLERLEESYNAPLRVKKFGLEFAGRLNMSLGMVKRGCGELPGEPLGCSCIRDAYLVQRWAESAKVDLREMDRRRGEFRLWVNEHVGRPAMVTDLRRKETREGFVSPKFSGDRDPRFKTLCSAVRFRVEFADKPAVYLTDCEVRQELRPEELKELKRDLGFATRHERKIRKGKQKGGQNTSKLKQLTRKEQDWLRKEYVRNLGLYPKSKIAAARRTAKSLNGMHPDFEVDPRTIQNWFRDTR